MRKRNCTYHKTRAASAEVKSKRGLTTAYNGGRVNSQAFSMNE
jgi:hypothetical protein